MSPSTEQSRATLRPYLSPMGAWAFALGTSIGWGSLVVTSNSYLLQAGPWGSLFGLLVGAAAMVIVARNYHYLISFFPDSGGAYSYTKNLFGYDFGFLTAWFLSLTYIAIFWANVTSLPLFAQYFIGSIFKVGYLYTVFGYDVYLGEAMLCILAIVLVALICIRSRKAVMYAMIGMALLLIVGITACFIAAALGHGGEYAGLEPGFLPDKSAFSQVMLIACISPWAFIGFENISHSAEEFSFSHTKTFRVMLAAVVTATVLYAFVILLSVMAYPPEYSSWFDYISDLENLSGIEALPPFYVAHHYLGDYGVLYLMVALLALVGTSLVGNLIALSRLLHALAKDDILPRRIAQIGQWHTPTRAIIVVAALSMFIPFLGRTAIGWIVDVTTLGAAIIYGFVSACTMRAARAQSDRRAHTEGFAGVVLMLVVGINLLLPNLLLSQGLETESYFLFVSWGILGFIVFRMLLGRDSKHRFGRSVAVWTALLALVMLVSFVWINQSLTVANDSTKDEIVAHFQDDGTQDNLQSLQHQIDGTFVERELDDLEKSGSSIMLMAAILIAIASALLLTNFSYMSNWAQRNEKELDKTRDIVYTDPLTKLPSMTRFQEYARTGAEAIRERNEHPVAIALDLVGMRDYNANNGREAGDALLCAFADVLKDHFTSQSCSRYAEDHFYAYAAERGVDDKLRGVFADFKVATEGSTLPVRAGAYKCAEDDDIVEVGFDRARTACDLDRRSWQSHVTWYNDIMSDEARKRLYVLDHVDEAIEKRWIRPYYQAVVDASTGEICDDEALARWLDPEHGFLSPDDFIPILEKADLLHKVDMHIIDCVIEDFVVKREHGVPITPVSVNVSLRDIEHLDMAQHIIQRVNDSGEPHDLLHVEFTESVASDDPELIGSQMNTLQAAGFEVWMDDFGSGYSSLNSLKDFDFDVVKLDMKFIEDTSSEKTWDIVEGVVQMAQKIGMRTLAEGVETEEQAERLKKAGCKMLQGYFYAKPLPLETILEERCCPGGSSE